MSAADSLRLRIDPIQRRATVVGTGALALCAFGAFLDLPQFFRSYLVAYIFWCGIALGCLGIVMIHHLVGGRWGFLIQRSLESAGRTFPLLALLFIPLLFGLNVLYPWARPEVVAGDELLKLKSPYLNQTFFIMRTVFYLLVWIAMGQFLSRWSLSQDRRRDPSLLRRLQVLSGPGILLYVLTVTFSSIDWMMSLEPKWFSAIYGLMFVVGHGLAALAFIIPVTILFADSEPLSRLSAPNRFHDLGNLLLAFVMLWAYLAFSQFLIIWAENLLEEIPWYMSRTAGGWGAVAVILIIFQFALPFLLLLVRATKRKVAALRSVAVGVLLMCLVDLFWLLAPAFHPEGLKLHWLDILTVLGVGGVWLAVFFSHLKKVDLLPIGDPRLAEALEEAHEA